MPWSLVVGFIIVVATGALFSSVGLGGGVIFTPLLLALGVPFYEATATSLFMIMVTSVSAAVTYHRGRLVDWKLALVIAPLMVICAFMAGLLADRVDTAILKLVFAGLVVFASFVVVRPLVAGKAQEGSTMPVHGWHRQLGSQQYVIKLRWLIPVGGATGAVASLLGGGGGVFNVPAMALLGGVPMHVAVGTSSLMMAITTAAGLTGHVLAGHFEPALAITFGVAALIGGQIGSRIAMRINRNRLSWLLAGMLLVIAVWMIISALVK